MLERVIFYIICPSYEVPSKYEFWNCLWDKNFEGVKHANLDRNKKSLCLTDITDGWSSVRNEVSFDILTQNFHSGQSDSTESDQNKKGEIR